ncbi:hypothetical protein RFF05_01780 [Bengtsoniella intestinalis]|uniref:hypothetical protein n=1 Tax=Bengtsoniella intestinalis TaxID=3073143 RepID=UPI00391F4D9D
MELQQTQHKALVERQIPAMEELLGLSTPDGRTGFALETSLMEILAYIHCDTLPKALENTWLLITAAQSKEGTFDASLAVSSLSRGDVSTTFTTPSQRNSDGFFGYKATLDGYRKVRH